MLCDGSLGGCRVSRCPRWGDLSQGQPRVLGPSLSCNLSATLQDRTSLVANFANRAIMYTVRNVQPHCHKYLIFCNYYDYY